MLESIFISVLNMSLIACMVVVAVLIARIPLKKTPKIFSYILWGVVLFKLICPFSFESAIGVLPNNQQNIISERVFEYTPSENTKPIIETDKVISDIIITDTVQNTSAEFNFMLLVSIIWVIGLTIIVFIGVVQYMKLKNQLKTSIHIKENIYSAKINSPFVFGIIRPKIYIPADLDSKEINYIVYHEKHHIKRLDHITRLVSYFVLAIHWFNPLVWLAYSLSAKDMEMSCDEAVIRKFDYVIKREYSSSLLRFAAGKGAVSMASLAFGDGDTKRRVENIMIKNKPLLAVSIIAVIAIIILTIALTTNAYGGSNSDLHPNNIADEAELHSAYLRDVSTGESTELKSFDEFLRENEWEKLDNTYTIDREVDYTVTSANYTLSFYATEPDTVRVADDFYNVEFYSSDDIYNKLLSEDEAKKLAESATVTDEEDTVEQETSEASEVETTETYEELNNFLSTAVGTVQDSDDRIKELLSEIQQLIEAYDLLLENETETTNQEELRAEIDFLVNQISTILSNDSYILAELSALIESQYSELTDDERLSLHVELATINEEYTRLFETVESTFDIEILTEEEKAFQEAEEEMRQILEDLVEQEKEQNSN